MILQCDKMESSAFFLKNEVCRIQVMGFLLLSSYRSIFHLFHILLYS